MKAFMKYILTSFSIMLLMACSSMDLAFINEVKRFEPQWMNLSEKSAFIDQKLSITGRRYPKDLELVEAQIQSSNVGDNGNEVYGLRSQYRKIMGERQKLEERFEAEKKSLTQQVQAFNEWETKLMKNKWDEGFARKRFEEFKKDQQKVQTEIDEIQSLLVRNIRQHNDILSRIAQLLGMYNNFEIETK